MLPSGGSRSIPELVSRPFVLAVGTLEVRKNHRLLYRLWTRMRSDPGFPGPPVLMIAGRSGWRVDDLFAEIHERPAVQDFIHHVDSPSDGEIEWLHDNCLFAVFPTFAEGFGLPVIERLAHGKCCISLNTSSLPEAGRNLTLLLDPLDFVAWYGAIRTFVQDPSLRREQETRIRESFTLSTRRDTSEAVYAAIEATGLAREAG